MNWLRGKKTYLLTGAGGVIVILSLAGVLEKGTADALLAACGFGSLAALRASLKTRVEARRAAGAPAPLPLVDETGKPLQT